MRILVAPDDFKESLAAAAAARAIALGWAQGAPADELDLCPLSDGGPGFAETLHTALGGELLATMVTGPLGRGQELVPATILRVGTTAYIEAAQACGLALVPTHGRNPTTTTTYGVGELPVDGAAGGLGFALLHLGATRAAGIGTVMEAVGFATRVANCDLVITGEGQFDWSSLRGKVVSGVAAAAQVKARPCVVIAGEVIVGRRDYSAYGVTSAYSISEIVDSTEISIAQPFESLALAAQRVARTLVALGSMCHHRNVRRPFCVARRVGTITRNRGKNLSLN